MRELNAKSCIFNLRPKYKLVGSHPLCAANTTEDRTEQLRLTMWCSLNYTGKEIPVFSWTKNNEQFNITAKTIIYPVPSSKISSITTHLQPKDIEVTFRCRITFQMQHNSTKDARNAYKYIWNYTLCKLSNKYAKQFFLCSSNNT